MKRVIGILLILVSCQSVEKAPAPDQLIPKDKMVAILTDIAFVKGAKGAYKKRIEEKKVNLETYVFQKHGIDSATFAQNNKWYANELEEYQELFSQVKENLSKEKTKYQKLKKAEDSIKKIEDSIKKAKGLKVDPDLRKLETEMMFEDEIRKQKLKNKFKKNLKKPLQ